MSIGKLHKDFVKKLLNFSVLHKFRPKRLSPAGHFITFLHSCQLGKLHKKWAEISAHFSYCSFVTLFTSARNSATPKDSMYSVIAFFNSADLLALNCPTIQLYSFSVNAKGEHASSVKKYILSIPFFTLYIYYTAPIGICQVFFETLRKIF